METYRIGQWVFYKPLMEWVKILDFGGNGIVKIENGRGYHDTAQASQLTLYPIIAKKPVEWETIDIAVELIGISPMFGYTSIVANLPKNHRNLRLTCEVEKP